MIEEDHQKDEVPKEKLKARGPLSKQVCMRRLTISHYISLLTFKRALSNLSISLLSPQFPDRPDGA
jgi:hypothetical protein